MFLGLVLLPIVVWFSMDHGGGIVGDLNAIDPSLTNWFGIAKRNFKASLTTNDIQQHENLITAKEYAFERMKIYV